MTRTGQSLGAGDHSAANTSCRNCGASLHGPYCAQCGQHDIDYHRFLGFIVEDSLEGFLHLDGKFLKTVRYLFTRPGYLTQEFIAGRRMRYAHPLRLYLFVSFLSFLVLAFTPSSYKPPASPESQMRADAAGLENPQLAPDARRWSQRLRLLFRPQVVASEEFSSRLRHLLPGALLLCIPLLALLLKIAYASSHRFYIEHLIFALHLQAFFLLAILLRDGVVWALQHINSSAAAITGTILSVLTVYAFYRALRVVYQQGAVLTVFKLTFVGISYGIVVILAGLLAVLGSVSAIVT